MWKYERKLEFPVNIKKKDFNLASYIVTQLGGPDGELGAFLRYFCQSFTMPDENSKLLLREIATEELAHVEIICEMLKQLTDEKNIEKIKKEHFGGHYADHMLGIFPTNASGYPYNAIHFASKGDYITDLVEDMAAEAKAKATYEALMDLTEDLDVLRVLEFLREREIVHFQRFGECLMRLKKDA